MGSGMTGLKCTCIARTDTHAIMQVMDSFVHRHVALFNHSARRFVQMRESGNIRVLSEVDRPHQESWCSWERFLVVNAGNGKVALHCPVHSRFNRIDGEYMNGGGDPKHANELPPEQQNQGEICHL